MNAKRIKTALAASIIPLCCTAQDFLCTDLAENPFTCGIRLGLNTSNRTFPDGIFNQWNVNNWGTGVEAGFVFDLNMRDYFSLQPGIFFETRSGNYAYATNFINLDGEIDDYVQLGHFRTCNITIPVLFSARFNLSGSLRWLVEAGPYVQMQLYDNSKNDVTAIKPQYTVVDPIVTTHPESKKYDAGVKVGSGFTLFSRYTIAVHYLAGCRRVWKAPCAGGHNKAWSFTVGYDF